MIQIHCIAADCMFNNGLAMCANTCPELHGIGTEEDMPEYNCGSFVSKNELMEIEEW